MIRRLLRQWFGFDAGYEECRKRSIEIIEQIMVDEMYTPIDKHRYGRAAGELFIVALRVDRRKKKVAA